MLPGILRRLRNRLIGGELRRVPLLRQFLVVHPENLLERVLIAPVVARAGAQQVADGALAVLAGDEGPERLAVAVREVLGVVQVLDVGELLAAGCFAHPHRGVRIDRTDRQVLGHPFDEPERQRQGARRVAAHVRPGDVVLERVHQFVPDYVIGGRNRTGQGKNDTALVGFRDAAGALADRSLNGVRLAEVGAARIQDQRLAPVELVSEQLRQPRIPPLRHPRRHAGRVRLFGVVVDIEVIRLEDLEIEVVVLDLVGPEIAPLRQQGRRQREDAKQQQDDSCSGTHEFSTSLARTAGDADFVSATDVPVIPQPESSDDRHAARGTEVPLHEQFTYPRGPFRDRRAKWLHHQDIAATLCSGAATVRAAVCRSAHFHGRRRSRPFRDERP